MENLTKDYLELSKKIPLDDSIKFTLILNLLAVKNGIRDAFCWNAPEFPNKADYEGHWSKFDIECDGSRLHLLILQNICTDLGLEMELVDTRHHMHFSHILIKKTFPKILDSDIEEIEKNIFSEMPTFWISSKSIMNHIKNHNDLHNYEISKILMYPSCCGNWFVDTKTQLLINIIHEHLHEHNVFRELIGSDFDSETIFTNAKTRSNLINYCIQKFENGEIIQNEKFKEEMYSNAEKSSKKFPFVFHNAVCPDCMTDLDSPTMKLNKKYGDFAKKINLEFFEYLQKNSISANL